ncbi:MBL fold metallo-hydrolase [Candidatus Pelagibacter sp. Uisw_090]|uniref:MBL fold metallo-hydrolase n=1 Tax=Candidatus Pelagibacter sp. Uisw_090 TaxID=3230993 RepID=UPI0039EAD929
MIEFNFINHSSFSIKKDNTRLTVDPWIEGSVFNNSWKLLVKTPTVSVDIVKNSDYVWFSHEHPDHFNPPNLKIFDNNAKFIFQKTKDKRVVNFLSKISNNVIEASSNHSIKLADNFFIKVFPFQDIDSFCLITINNKKILNLNDCDIKSEHELNEIKNKVGDVDILFGQFSYAIGKSNRSEKNNRMSLSKDILDNLSHVISVLKPNFFVPFASFCYFSHLENFYLNDSINKIDHTINYLSQKNPNTKLLTFYPGDKWDLTSKKDNILSITKYLNDYTKIVPEESSSKITNYETLIQIADAFIKKTKQNNSMFFLYNFFKYKDYNIIFNIHDLNIYLKFDYLNGLRKINDFNKNHPHCELSSDSLFQLFNSGYGYDALMIGGRFEANNSGQKSLEMIFKFQTKNYQNHFYNFSNVIPKLWRKLSKFSRVNPVR